MIFPNNDPTSTRVLLELTELFVQENGERLERWKIICAKQESASLLREAHYLAGSSLSLGLQRLGKLCQNIEVAIKNQNFEVFDLCYDVTKSEFDGAVKALREYAKQR